MKSFYNLYKTFKSDIDKGLNREFDYFWLKLDRGRPRGRRESFYSSLSSSRYVKMITKKKPRIWRKTTEIQAGQLLLWKKVKVDHCDHLGLSVVDQPN